MKTNEIFVGIDVSKSTLDICVLSKTKKLMKIKNTPSAIISTLSKYSATLKVCMENTGRYNWPVYKALKELSNVEMFVVPALHLKRSMGLIRGKDDQIDAIRIAEFIQKNHTQLQQTPHTSVKVEELRVLLTERKQRIKIRSQLKQSAQDYSLMEQAGMTLSLKPLNQQLIAQINQQIKELEQQIQRLIKSDNDLNTKSQLMQSVPGVGKIICWMLLAKTNGFTIMTNPRKLACYAGVVPFSYSSGTSINKKDRVSSLADKALKTVLHLGAMRAVREDNDLREYYLRKVNEGKNKMLVLNAVRNKLIHRICAVVNNQKMYQNNLLMS